MKYKYLFLTLLLTSLLSSCSGHVPTESGKDLLPAQIVDLHECRIAAQDALCGYLPVRENPALKNGRIINLNIAIIKASDPEPRPDPIFFLAGGPGEAATESTGNIEFLNWVFQGDRDIVLVDQRGTGGSHNILVPPGPDFSGLSGADLDKDLSRWIEHTLAELDMDPRYYTTSVAMDDLDAVRRALGYEQINLYGTSYGATAAEYYLRQYEDHVRTAVLLAGSLLDMPVFELEARHAQRTLDLVFDQCENDDVCQAAFPDLRDEFAALLEQLDQQSVEVALQAGTVTLTRDYFAAKVEWMTRDRQRITSLPFWIHKAYQDDDWKAFAEAGIHDFGPHVMTYAIRCNEKWAVFSPDEVIRQGADSYLAGWSVSQAERYALICKYIPDGEIPEGQLPQPPSDKPVLLFNGDWDILNPPENVAGARQLWPNSLALSIPWQSHEISDTGTAMCIAGIVREFVSRATVDGLDITCLNALPAPIFRTR